jgi:hypothetical protein
MLLPVDAIGAALAASVVEATACADSDDTAIMLPIVNATSRECSGMTLRHMSCFLGDWRAG